MDKRNVEALQQDAGLSVVEKSLEKRRKRSHEGTTQYGCDVYTVGIICALPHEMAAASAMLDESHADLTEQDSSDHNSYKLGRIRDHYVVIASLPAGLCGTNPAATVSKDMLRTFNSLRFGLVIGIGGAAPSKEYDIRLGDVVVSQPSEKHGGVIQIDLGRKKQQGGFDRFGSLNRPPVLLLTALGRMQPELELGQSSIPQNLLDMIEKYPALKNGYSYQGEKNDILFKADYIHREGRETCDTCSTFERVVRETRGSSDPRIYFGNIASSIHVMKDALARDRLSKALGVLCFETEAAGLFNFPSLVVRGISDYADSHKNNMWQRYAAASAAAFAKEFLRFVPRRMVEKERPIVPEPVAENIREQLEKLNARYEEDILRECLQAFDVCTYEAQKNINPDRVEGTCVWALESQNFVRWRSSEQDDLLWVSADPGCGKSVLSKSLVDKEFSDSDSYTVCYFFFKDNMEQDRVATALCAVLHQLFSKRPQLLRHAIKKWEQMKNTLQTNTYELWRLLISSATHEDAGNVICIFDALDECQKTERNLLIRFLREFYDASYYKQGRKSQLKFLATSRPYNEIEIEFNAMMRAFPLIRLKGEIENKKIQKEINLVISFKLLEITHQLELKEDVRESIIQKLRSIEHRTYLWLHLVLDELRESLKRSAKSLNQILDQIPETVDEAYEALLNRNTKDSENREEAKTLLSLVVAAKRPLTLKEMDVAFNLAVQGLEPSVKELELDGVDLAIRIRNFCGIFIFVRDSRIYLIHQTAKEFLVNLGSNESLKSGGWKPSLQVKALELLWSRVCIHYILSLEYDNFYVDKKGFGLKEQSSDVDRLSWELFPYAAGKWPDHLRAAALDEFHPLSYHAFELYNSKNPAFETWVYVNRDRTSSLGLTPLYLAAYHGQVNVIKMLLQDGVNVNDLEICNFDKWWEESHSEWEAGAGVPYVLRPSSKYGTPLEAASRRGYWEAVLLLLESGADPRIVTVESPLRCALDAGNDRMAQQLLTHGADIEDFRYSMDAHTPLQVACARNMRGTVRLLLEKGVNVNRSTSSDETALQVAAREGCEEIVRLLLDAGADMKLENMGVDALHVAARNGHQHVVELLLRRGADCNISGYAGTPLHYAAEHNHHEVVQILLKHGRVDINAQKKISGETALDVAEAAGHQEAARILRDNGALCSSGLESRRDLNR